MFVNVTKEANQKAGCLSQLERYTQHELTVGTEVQKRNSRYWFAFIIMI
jgi:hypothetical protein